ncbi:unnamed protein product [Cylindrotheca closterium]|uniref:HIT-type domain-containing protein n=1 Tax=Cylindrotheca closterium TaxID=2856 RepID=A0AAD2FT69_9STRA|nr:unnamed protein product [Cylindrotheca closterium]
MAQQYPAQKPSQPFQRKRNGNGRNFNHNRKRQRNQKTPAEEKPKISCIICAVEEPKYKCPKCTARYCTVACCKKHKEVCPGIPGNSTATSYDTASKAESSSSPSIPTTSKSKYTNSLDMEQTMAQCVAKRQEQLESENYQDDDDDSIDEGWKITEEMKQALFHSEWLRDELQDGGLRLLIGQVVSIPHGPRKHQVLQEIKERYPSFGVFVDKLLYLTGVLEEEDDKATILSKEVLEADWTEEGMRPTLALKTKEKKKMPVFEPVSQSSSSEEEDSSGSEEDDSSSSEEESD